jgi:arylsulfatase A
MTIQRWKCPGHKVTGSNQNDEIEGRAAARRHAGFAGGNSQRIGERSSLAGEQLGRGPLRERRDVGRNDRPSSRRLTRRATKALIRFFPTGATRVSWSRPAALGGRTVALRWMMAVAAVAILQTVPLAASASTAPARPPNFVLLLCDNLGYGDVAPFGSTLHRTPNLDRMAREGMKLTHFYSASGVCTPSRAALMTGCYPLRVNLHKNARGGGVLQPVEPIGLNPSETTIAEVLKARGYATKIIGKWHLGDQPPFLPTRQGFDSYIGIPYSDDMTPREGQPWPDLPLMRDETVIEAPVDRTQLTRRETEDAIRFMTENRARPFFLYVPHAMPGSTQAPFASEAFRGKSRNGPWGDAVEELDWSAGQILDAVKRLGLEENTLVIWTSDNGAPRRNPVQGSNLPLGGWGYTTAEGGMRIPGIVRWPGRVPAGAVCDELTTLMDVLPTFASLAGGRPPSHAIDGKNIWPLLSGEPGARTPHEAFYYYHAEQLQAVRSGNWKLYLPLSRRRAPRAGAPINISEPARLYDVMKDSGETNDVAAAHADVVARLETLAATAREEIGDLERLGRAQRPAGWVADPQPQRLQRVK